MLLQSGRGRKRKENAEAIGVTKLSGTRWVENAVRWTREDEEFVCYLFYSAARVEGALSFGEDENLETLRGSRRRFRHLRVPLSPRARQ